MVTTVFDCVVYVQAVLSNKGPAFACLSLAEAKHVSLHFSPDILDELQRSLNTPSLRKKAKRLTDERVKMFLKRVVNAGTLAPNPPAVYSLKRDPKDEPYLNLAVAVQASFIVSRDKDLLDLMKDGDFRKAFPFLTVIEPDAFLTHVRTQIAKGLKSP